MRFGPTFASEAEMTVLRERLSGLERREQISRQVNETARSMFGPRHRVIHAKVIGEMTADVERARGLLLRWLTLQESRPDQRQRQPETVTVKLRQDLERLHDEVLTEIEQFDPVPGSRLIQAGKMMCRRAITSIHQLFDPDRWAEQDVEPRPGLVLGRDLLRVPGLELDEEWRIVEPGGLAAMSTMIDAIAMGLPDWPAAFDKCLARRDHLGATRVLDALGDVAELPAESYAELVAKQQQLLDESRLEIKAKILDTEDRVEGAVAYGLLTEDERGRALAAIDPVRRAAESALRFGMLGRELDAIKLDVERSRERAVEQLRARVESEEHISGSPGRDRIDEALARGDVLSAHEYLNRLLHGDADDDHELPSGVDPWEYFPSLAREIHAGLENFTTNPEVIEAIRARQSFGGLDLTRISEQQAVEAADMLDAWFTIKTTQRAYEATIRRVLQQLGFRQIKLGTIAHGKDTPKRVWVDVHAEHIASREVCPVPYYGSEAHGHYRLAILWGKAGLTDLQRVIDDESGPDGRVIVLYLERLSEKDRRDLGRRFRDRLRTVVVLDEILLLALCGVSGSRMASLFTWAMQFAHVEPYTSTASSLPPEMFFGRQREQGLVKDPHGPSFIFGGRQLGKTALLRKVERDFNDQNTSDSPPRHIALWIDLKTRQIGYNRPADDIWQVIGDELRKSAPRVLQPRAGRSSVVRRESLLREIEQWLTADVSRRLLLLLDEADSFLEIDGTPVQDAQERPIDFVRSSALKGLMDRTDGRFKVVFAGLHNVVRTTVNANHPFGQLGDPICIGPLLDLENIREARALVEQPLAYLGYRFESPQLITRVLALTNYYPSLIQIFCQHLIKQMQTRAARSTDGPPFAITGDVIDRTYREKDVTDAIRGRFSLTLQLDRRYEVIAYAIAAEFLEAGESDGRAFERTWIRDASVSWWPAGFKTSTSLDQFQSLLDEMVGLGVLRRIGDTSYTLRNPNIVLLMGTRKQVDDKLLELSEADPPLEYAPSVFRAADPTDIARRSPLTARQLQDVTPADGGVTVAFGIPVADVSALANSLQVYVQPTDVIVVDDYDQAAFGRRVWRQFDRTTHDRRAILVVPAERPWTVSWIEEALRHMRERRQGRGQAHVLFIADPARAWQFLREDTDAETRLQRAGARFVTLEPWHDLALRQWLVDCNFGELEAASRQDIAEVTGRWPLLLREFYEQVGSEHHRWKDHLESVAQALQGEDRTAALPREFGLEHEDVSPVLSQLVRETPPSTAEILEYLPTVSAERVEHVLRWARLIGIVHPVGADAWQLDPIVERVLTVSV